MVDSFITFKVAYGLFSSCANISDGLQRGSDGRITYHECQTLLVGIQHPIVSLRCIYDLRDGGSFDEIFRRRLPMGSPPACSRPCAPADVRRS